MSQDARSPEIGCRWECSKGKQGCPRCAALHGQEFYKNPAPGQQSTADLPQPPLHPNCRCKVMPILDIVIYVGKAEVRQGERRYDPPRFKPIMCEADVDDGIVIPGVGVCGNGGRSLLDGPGYGYYFGSNYSAGQNITGDDPKETLAMIEKLDLKPVDRMDDLAKIHDMDYLKIESDCQDVHSSFIGRYDCEYRRKLKIDEELVRGLKALPEDPTQWGGTEPWTPERIEYAKKMRRLATWYFEGVAATKRRMLEGDN